MNKKNLVLLFTVLAVLSGVKALAADDDINPPPRTVPDAGSSALLVGTALTGLAGLRFVLKKK